MDSLVIAFVTGLTTGGLSCLAVQGGLLASSIAHEVEQTVAAQPVVPLARTISGRRAASSGRGKAGADRQVAPVEKPAVRPARPILLFLIAKVIAYTLLGFLLGLLGSVLQLNTTTRAILQAAIGVFMLGTALRMLNVHPIFRYFVLEPPHAVTRYIRRKAKGQATAVTPLFLGALTVLIPCGVTQAMMAVAMATGNGLTGATTMLAFTLGTTPVFFTVAYLATRLGSRLETSFIRVVAVLVLVLGLVSIDSGLTLAGWPYSFTNLRIAMTSRNAAAESPVVSRPLHFTPQPLAGTPPAGNSSVSGDGADGGGGAVTGLSQGAQQGAGVLTINVKNDGYHPTVTRAKANEALKVAFVSNETYSCARALVVPALSIEKLLPETGTVLIDIPAQPAGSKLFFSCSMGMYSGVIVFDS